MRDYTSWVSGRQNLTQLNGLCWKETQSAGEGLEDGGYEGIRGKGEGLGKM